MLTNLAKRSNVYILAVLDCSRETYFSIERPTRGGGSSEKYEITQPDNLIMIYSCRRGRSCRADSNLTKNLLSKLRSMVKADFSLVLPDKLVSWRVPDGGEIAFVSP
jgi:hypothetical protein